MARREGMTAVDDVVEENGVGDGELDEDVNEIEVDSDGAEDFEADWTGRAD